jgi:hypothetical protein
LCVDVLCCCHLVRSFPREPGAGLGQPLAPAGSICPVRAARKRQQTVGNHAKRQRKTTARPKRTRPGRQDNLPGRVHCCALLLGPQSKKATLPLGQCRRLVVSFSRACRTSGTSARSNVHIEYRVSGACRQRFAVSPATVQRAGGGHNAWNDGCTAGRGPTNKHRASQRVFVLSRSVSHGPARTLWPGRAAANKATPMPTTTVRTASSGPVKFTV